jgi:hypothetical protein
MILRVNTESSLYISIARRPSSLAVPRTTRAAGGDAPTAAFGHNFEATIPLSKHKYDTASKKNNVWAAIQEI